MHTNFADWYSIAAISNSQVDLRARWSGVEGVVEESTAETVLDCARLFYALPPKRPDFLDWFRRIFKAADDRFPMIGAPIELQVLAGASLIHEIEHDALRNLAALAVTCASFRGQRAAPVSDIVSLAREQQATASASLRQREPSALPTTESITNTLAASVARSRTALKSAADPTTTGPIGDTLQAIADTIIGIFQQVDLYNLENDLRREESDVLWWLFSEQSRDLKLPFERLALAPATLVAAKEMADLTRSLSPPYSVAAFLDKALRKSKREKKREQISLAEAVSAAPVAWLKGAVAARDFDATEDLTPVTFALRKSIEADGSKSWLQVYKNVTGLDAATSMDATELAQQLYEERMLARCLIATQSA